MITCGIDIGKGRHAVALLDESGREIGQAKFYDNTRQGAEKLLGRLRGLSDLASVHIGMESTGNYWRAFHDYFAKAGCKLDHRLRFVRRRNEDGPFNPDGRDFSRQPGVWDILWQLTCTHSFSTYVAWMKSAEAHGPDSVFYNWDDENDIPHNEWLIDYIF